MALPQLPANLQLERAGILAVATELNRLGLIWRETPMADVGIDGQIEFVSDTGEATGRLVAAQVKSGPSYFNHGSDEAWRFYPQEKHRFYCSSACSSAAPTTCGCRSSASSAA
jgi:hypothetical protein